MLSSDEGEDDVFFDSVDCLSSDESVVVKEELGCEKLEYEIWMNEPLSVKERRQSFLHEMGFIQLADDENVMAFDMSSEIVELGKLRECNDAVSSSSDSDISGVEDNLVCCGRETNFEANCLVDELEHDQENEQNMAVEAEATGVSPSVEECEQSEVQADSEECKKAKKWWKRLVSMKKRRESTCVSEVAKPNPKTSRTKVKQNKKRCMELTALFMGQEIQAHKGIIWTMKSSPDGQYLASGGEDGVVRVWRVTSTDVSCESFMAEGDFASNVNESKSSFGRKKSCHASVVCPEKGFQIDESPLHEFHGHSSDVLDLAWSDSNCLLSSSKDKTVRLWQVGCDQCLNVFRHNNYVTCIQFNPVDDNYFISGSIDGKVRIWGVSEKRVVGWADVRDAISAVCYQPNGNGFIVGTITGICRFYEASGNGLELEAELYIQGKKKTWGNKITGIQFSQESSQRVMITSEDSRLRILDGINVVHKFKGLPKSGSQMSASFTSTGKHIISVGEDCRVYVWNYNGLCNPSSKQIKSVRSCEHFFSEGVSVAVPWSGMGTEHRSLASNLQSHMQIQDHQEGSERFSLGNCFSIDGQSRGSATWPEEKLPLWDVTTAEDQYHHQHHQGHQQHHHHYHHNNSLNHTTLSESWGLVIVTAGWDGTIRTFHNYGLPVRLN